MKEMKVFKVKANTYGICINRKGIIIARNNAYFIFGKCFTDCKVGLFYNRNGNYKKIVLVK